MNLSAKTVVVIAIGAALYGIGGLPMFGIPVFANTTLKPAMAVLALFSVLFGPLVGFWLVLLATGSPTYLQVGAYGSLGYLVQVLLV